MTVYDQAMTRVTRERYPVLFECLEAISHDSGGGAGNDHYLVPALFAGSLGLIEITLKIKLPRDKDRETFCIGEEFDQQRLQLRDPMLPLIAMFFAEFFETWQHDPASPAEEHIAAFAARVDEGGGP